MNYPDTDKLAVDVYMAFRRRHGALSLVSGHRGQNDSTKLSRQLNPSDERRDSPFTEIVEILAATAEFAPDLEAELWALLERARANWRGTAARPASAASLGRMIHKVGDELNDVAEAVIDQKDVSRIFKEVYELKQVVLDLEHKVQKKMQEQLAA